jgi:NAD(P)-dependent dehydrogenase (short-subunit alcohol dehydrogenase family)
MHAVSRRVLVFGGAGALGRAVLGAFKASTEGWKSVNVDFVEAAEADDNIVLDEAANAQERADAIVNATTNNEFGSIISVAGAWTGASLKSSTLIRESEKMFSINAVSALTGSELIGTMPFSFYARKDYRSMNSTG